MDRELYTVFINAMNQNTFEDYAKEVIETKYELRFRSNRRTKDGGIDGMSQDEEKILQVKYYNSNFSNLKSTIQKEVKKVPDMKKQFPKFNEYILVTSQELSIKQSKEIKKLFDSLKINIIIFGLIELYNEFGNNTDLLNKYSDYAKYRCDELEKIISESLNIDYTSEAFFEEIKDFNYTHYRTTVFYEVLNSVTYGSKITIVTGKAGIGKTTVCSMVLSELLLENKYINFYNMDLETCLQKISTIKDNSIIYIDDFVGHNIFDTNSNCNALEKVYKQIRLNNRNIKILCNSRDYILQEFIEKSFETSLLIKGDMISIIDSDKITDIDKISIVKNIIEKNIVNITKDDLTKNCHKLIDHRHFTPRNLEQIANRDFTSMDDMLKFLDNSFDLYRDLYNNLPLELKQVIVDIYFLKTSKVDLDFRSKKNYDAIFETLFVSVTENIDSYLIEFKNFSIYDYVEKIIMNDYDKYFKSLLVKYEHNLVFIGRLIENSIYDDEKKYEYFESFQISNPNYLHKHYSKSEIIKNDSTSLKLYVENAIAYNYPVDLDDYLKYCKIFYKDVNFKYIKSVFDDEIYLDLYLNEKELDVNEIYYYMFDLDDFIITATEIDLNAYREKYKDNNYATSDEISEEDYVHIIKKINEEYWSYYSMFSNIFRGDIYDDVLELEKDKYSTYHDMPVYFKSEMQSLIEQIKIRLTNIEKVKEYQLTNEQISEVIFSHIENEIEIEADRMFEEQRIEKYVQSDGEKSRIDEICESISVDNG